jgi:hypothetical protein
MQQFKKKDARNIANLIEGIANDKEYDYSKNPEVKNDLMQRSERIKKAGNDEINIFSNDGHLAENLMHNLAFTAYYAAKTNNVDGIESITRLLKDFKNLANIDGSIKQYIDEELDLDKTTKKINVSGLTPKTLISEVQKFARSTEEYNKPKYGDLIAELAYRSKSHRDKDMSDFIKRPSDSLIFSNQLTNSQENNIGTAQLPNSNKEINPTPDSQSSSMPLMLLMGAGAAAFIFRKFQKKDSQKTKDEELIKLFEQDDKAKNTENDRNKSKESIQTKHSSKKSKKKQTSFPSKEANKPVKEINTKKGAIEPSPLITAVTASASIESFSLDAVIQSSTKYDAKDASKDVEIELLKKKLSEKDEYIEKQKKVIVSQSDELTLSKQEAGTLRDRAESAENKAEEATKKLNFIENNNKSLRFNNKLADRNIVDLQKRNKGLSESNKKITKLLEDKDKQLSSLRKGQKESATDNNEKAIIYDQGYSAGFGAGQTYANHNLWGAGHAAGYDQRAIEDQFSIQHLEYLVHQSGQEKEGMRQYFESTINDIANQAKNAGYYEGLENGKFIKSFRDKLQYDDLTKQANIEAIKKESEKSERKNPLKRSKSSSAIDETNNANELEQGVLRRSKSESNIDDAAMKFQQRLELKPASKETLRSYAEQIRSLPIPKTNTISPENIKIESEQKSSYSR